MTYTLYRRQLIPAAMDEVFAFFEDPHNLAGITPPWLGFTVLSSSDAQVREGTRLAYRMRVFRVPFRWEARIPVFVRGERFVDEMTRGPYARWYHRHLFRAVPEGVEMEDIVEYALPLGPIGTLAHALFVRRQVAEIFDYRAARVAERFARDTAHHGVHRT